MSYNKGYGSLAEIQRGINELSAHASVATGESVASISALLWSQRKVLRTREIFVLPDKTDLIAGVEAIKAGPGLADFLALRSNGELRRMPHDHSRLVSPGTFEKPESLVREATLLAANARALGPSSAGIVIDDRAKARALRVQRQEGCWRKEDMAKRDAIHVKLEIRPSERAELEGVSLKDYAAAKGEALKQRPGMDI